MAKRKVYLVEQVLDVIKSVGADWSKLSIKNEKSIAVKTDEGVFNYSIIKSNKEPDFDKPQNMPERAIVFPEISISDKHINESLNCQNWIFASSVSIEKCKFEKNSSFCQAVFMENLRLDGSIFEEGCDFTGANFLDGASFNETQFKSDTPFKGAFVAGSSMFNWTSFDKDPEFTGATFENVDFSGASFNSDATFSGVSFNDDAFFSGSAFVGSAEFSGATFIKNAEFTGAMFSAGSSFSWVAFNKNASFSGVVFTGEVSFSDARFEENALFSGTSFNENALFGSAIFAEDADFSGALFRLNVDFTSIQFKKNAHFLEASFEGEGSALCEDTQFAADAYFSGSIINKKVIFRKTEFSRRADFSLMRIQENGCIVIEESFFSSMVDFSQLQELTGKFQVHSTDFLRKLLIDFNDIKGIDGKFNALIVHDENGNIDNTMTKENFESFEEIFNKNKELDNELEIHYFVKVYERRSEYRWNELLPFIKNVTNKISQFLSFTVLDGTSRYFTSWVRVLISIAIAILFYTTLYCLSPMMNEISSGKWGSINGIEQDFSSAFGVFKYIYNNLYYSLITFTTIGYGDLLPTGLLRIIAGLEGFTGVNLTSLFLVTLGKRVLG